MFDIPDPGSLADDALIDAIVAGERAAAAVAAAQLAAIAELARRRPRSPDAARDGHTDAGHPRLPEVSEFAVDELAAALRLSRAAAGARLVLAVELTRLPRTAEALAAGVLDVPKARAVTEAVAALDTAAAEAVEDRVLPRAADRTVGQLRASLSRAVAQVDPAGAERRHEAAVAMRRVELIPQPEGMAALWAVLSAEVACGIYATLDAAARSTGAADPRPMDARRADTLAALVLTPRATTPALPSPPPHASSAVPMVATAPATSPSPATSLPTTGPAPSAGTPTPAGNPTPAGESRAEPGFVRATVLVTVPAATALGTGDEPGELAGYGPIPASMARRLAADGTWRKATVDEAGIVVDVDRRPYSPSAALADLVRARDRTCRFPGCRQPARRCDIDHVVPWPDGPTCECNLRCLCRHHHRLKHQTSWTVSTGPDDDTTTWTSPTGHRYTAPAA